MNTARLPSRQRGVALAVALILLVVLTLLALSGIRLSTMELRMAMNDELRVAAFEQAQSMVDTTVRRFTNTPILAPGVTRCVKTVTDKCTNAGSLFLSDDVKAKFGVNDNTLAVNVWIERIPPQNAEPPVNSGFSLSSFDAAYMQVTGLWDQNAIGRGAATVREGVAIVYGSAGDTTTTASTDEFTQDEAPESGCTAAQQAAGIC
jgi:hypothetical protein